MTPRALGFDRTFADVVLDDFDDVVHPVVSATASAAVTDGTPVFPRPVLVVLDTTCKALFLLHSAPDDPIYLVLLLASLPSRHTPLHALGREHHHLWRGAELDSRRQLYRPYTSSHTRSRQMLVRPVFWLLHSVQCVPLGTSQRAAVEEKPRAETAESTGNI